MTNLFVTYCAFRRSGGALPRGEPGGLHRRLPRLPQEGLRDLRRRVRQQVPLTDLGQQRLTLTVEGHQLTAQIHGLMYKVTVRSRRLLFDDNDYLKQLMGILPVV